MFCFAILFSLLAMVQAPDPGPGSPQGASMDAAPIQPYSLHGDFCSRHYCTMERETPRACCPERCAAVAGSGVHVLYLHVPKTGGSSIECATQLWQQQGGWDNMGHVDSPSSVSPCRQRCAAEGVATKTVVSVRDPYEYYASFYRYNWAGGNDWADILARIGIDMDRTHGALRSFATFMRAIDGDERATEHMSQAVRVARACGTPCAHDFVLRTESLQADWAAMLEAFGLPRIGLPTLNPSSSATPFGPPPPVEWTAELLAIVHRIEWPLFDEFGFAVRAPPAPPPLPALPPPPPPPCACFSLCTDEERRRFLLALPESVASRASPWYAYLVAVYRSDVPLPMDLRALEVFWLRLLPARTACADDGGEGNAAQLPLCAPGTCDGWLRAARATPAQLAAHEAEYALRHKAASLRVVRRRESEAARRAEVDARYGGGAAAAWVEVFRHDLSGFYHGKTNAADDWHGDMQCASEAHPHGLAEGYGDYGCWFTPMRGTGVFVHLGNATRFFGDRAEIEVAWPEVLQYPATWAPTIEQGVHHRDCLYAALARRGGYDSLVVVASLWNEHSSEIVLTTPPCMQQPRPLPDG